MCFSPFVVDAPDPMLVSIMVFVKIYIYSRDGLFTLHFSTILPVVRVCSGSQYPEVFIKRFSKIHLQMF